MTDVSNRDSPATADDERKFAPLCIWCSAPWSDENVSLEIESSGYCETCYSEDRFISITCHECKREMYRKEYV